MPIFQVFFNRGNEKNGIFFKKTEFGVVAIAKRADLGGGDQRQKNGANDRNRTDYLFITSELLYRLSYIGLFCLHNILLHGDLSSQT